VWASEIEKFPVEVTAKRFPKMKQLGDITKINGAEIEPVDIITAGFPCQSVSVAGKREGLVHDDGSYTRSGLVYEVFRIIREMKGAAGNDYPKYMMFENVPGLLSSRQGKDFESIMDEISGLGYIADIDMLDAQDFGVPQRRKRVFITCVSIDYLMGNGHMIISESIAIQLIFELLLNSLGAHLKERQIAPRGLGVTIPLRTAESLKRTINTFALTEASRLNQLRAILGQITAKLGDGQEMSLGECWDESLRIANERIISIAPREVTQEQIDIYMRPLLNAARHTVRYLDWVSQAKKQYHSYFYWVHPYMLEIKEYINAAVKYSKKYKQVGWNDNIRHINEEIQNVENEVKRFFGNERAVKILSFGESVFGDIAEGV